MNKNLSLDSGNNFGILFRRIEINYLFVLYIIYLYFCIMFLNEKKRKLLAFIKYMEEVIFFQSFLIKINMFIQKYIGII